MTYEQALAYEARKSADRDRAVEQADANRHADLFPEEG